MAGTPPRAGGVRALLGRVAARLTTPQIYLLVLGALQLLMLWEFLPLFGPWPAIVATVGWLGLVGAIVGVRGRWQIKLGAVALMGVCAAIVPTAMSIVARPHAGITIEHDGLLQVETAIDRLLAGKPIYGVDWTGTAMDRPGWHLIPGGNPALHHFAYYPLTVLVGVPFRIASGVLGLPFDYRVVLTVFALLGLAAILFLPIAAERRFMVLTAIYFNPLITLYLWPGRNDIEFLACVLACLALLMRGRVTLAALALGIAVAFKPFAWFAVPFFVLALFLRWRAARSWRELLTASIALGTPAVLTIAPFFFANPSGFWDDIVRYAAGGTRYAYPIVGYGFSELLIQTRIIAHRTDSFPFGIFQLAAVLPVLWFAGRAFLRRPTAARWMLGYAALLFAFTFFARFFNDNYFGVVVALFLCAGPLGNRLLTAAPAQPAETLAAA